MTHQPDEPSTANDRTETRDVADAAIRIARQLEERGVRVASDDDADELARLLDAVELFEQAVAALGGDSYMNAPGARRPERPAYVVPRRHGGESAAAYSARVREAAERLG